ncbi:MAG: protein-glutamate O-methyltransferase CheR [Nitrospirota bacterium]
MSDPSSASVGPDPAIPPMTDLEYERFRTYIYEHSGIQLGPAKKELLAARLARRLRDLELSSYGEYFRRLVQGDKAEEISLFDAVSTNETHFFREPQHFEFLRDVVFPRWDRMAAAGLRSRTIRMWSAACATGQEVYSLAMVAEDRFPAAAGWDVEILATDLSVRALEAARVGVWSLDQKHEIPEKFLKAYMLKGVAGQRGRMKAAPSIRALLRFARVNLNNEVYPVGGPFDVIFCRNVLIYFDAGAKARVVDRLMGYLAPGGYLILGQVESATGLTDRLRAVGPTVYVRADAETLEAA